MHENFEKPKTSDTIDALDRLQLPQITERIRELERDLAAAVREHDESKASSLRDLLAGATMYRKSILERLGIEDDQTNHTEEDEDGHTSLAV